MKKTFLSILSLLLIFTYTNAQSVIEKGDIGLNVGIGVGGTGGLFPSLEAAVEYAAIPTGSIGIVSFGGKAAYKYSRYNYSNFFNNNLNEDFHYNQFEFGVRAAWHLLYFNNSKWDAYAGFGSGLHLYSDYRRFDSSNNRPLRNGRSGIYVEGFVGGRMMMSESFGFYAEAGYSHTSAARIGLTFLF
ncbi:MAG: hypothetical protein CVT95_09750 [Bacteroidetes bacterium HGW-Bacteroidetes-12]|nr:MAG: hypothetical protein CVT95_09750 [Bacteroidetes bacterium HGW-Bacteroidetes-12]